MYSLYELAISTIGILYSQIALVIFVHVNTMNTYELSVFHQSSHYYELNYGCSLILFGPAKISRRLLLSPTALGDLTRTYGYVFYSDCQKGSRDWLFISPTTSFD